MFAVFLLEDMNPFYENVSSFPTVIFTFFLGLALLYWIVAVLGMVDIEIFDFDLPEGDAAGSSPDVLAGLMLRFGLQGVPVTVILSFIFLFGWLISYYLSHFFLGWTSGWMRLLVGLPVFIVALVASALITSVILKPFKSLFKNAKQQSAKDFVGRTVVVRTSRVDHEFGEANLDDGGAGMVIKVRSMSEDVFTRGDRVVLLNYVSETGVYQVVSETEFLGNQ
jgi:hypothetical protein